MLRRREGTFLRLRNHLYSERGQTITICTYLFIYFLIEKQKNSSNEKKTSENFTELPDDFNSFQYWRDPIPDFDDCDIPSSAKTHRRKCKPTYRSFLRYRKVTKVS